MRSTQLDGRGRPPFMCVVGRMGTLASRVAVLAGCCLTCADAVPLAPPTETPSPEISSVALDERSLSEGRIDSLLLPISPTLASRVSFEVIAHDPALDVRLSGRWVGFRPAPSWTGRDTVLVRARTTFAPRTTTTFRIPLRVNPGPYEVRRNPYASVSWGAAPFWKVQLHDHPGVKPDQYAAYDSAGYDAVVLMDYSGVPSLPYAWRQRRWPPADWLPAPLLSGFRNLKMLIPAGEEVGFHHLASPFMVQYIEKWDPLGASREPWQYGSSQEGIDLIRAQGGMAIMSHPWSDGNGYDFLRRYDGIEIYSAFAAYKSEDQPDPFFQETDRNALMRARWDRALARSPRVVGIAVNDHFGPGSGEANLSPRNRDSGKMLVFVSSSTLESLQRALVDGQSFAVEDRGSTKGQHPTVDSVWVDAAGIHVATDGAVTWISHGMVISTGLDLPLTWLRGGSRYVRFESRNGDGSAVYSQAFELGLVGDSNNDGVVNEADAPLSLRSIRLLR